MNFGCIAHICTIQFAIIIVGCSSSLASPADQFKKFLESPPVIEELTWVVSQKANPDPQDQFFRSNYFTIRWQTNAYTMRMSTNLADFEHPQDRALGMESGKFDNYYWTIFGSNFQFTDWTDTGDPDEADNGVYRTFYSDGQTLSYGLRMGLPWMNSGSIHWNEDALTFTNKRGNTITAIVSGSIRESVNGLVDEFHVSVDIKPDGKLIPTQITAEYLLKYFYEDSIMPPFLPSRAEFYVINGSRMFQSRQVRYLAFKTNSTTATEAFYSPVNLLRGGQHYVVKGKELLHDDHGTFKKLLDPNDPRLVKSTGPALISASAWFRSPRFLMIAGLLIALTFLLFWWLSHKRT